jgi:hypothetical protein
LTKENSILYIPYYEKCYTKQHIIPERRTMRSSILLLLTLVLLAGSAEAATAVPNLYMPTVTTSTPSAVTDTSAELYGIFSIKSPDTLKSTSWQFTIREGSIQGHAEVCPDQWVEITADILEVTVHCPVLGLKPSITYFFALYVHFTRNGVLETYSGDWVQFQTNPSVQPVVSTNLPSGITDTTATMNGMYSIPSPGTLKGTSWRFTVREGSIQAVSGQIFCHEDWTSVTSDTNQLTVSCPVNGLKPSTTYFFALYVQRQRAVLETYSSDWNQFNTNPSTPTLLPITDWALSNLRILSSSPKVGDHVMFAVELTALSTSTPYPQQVENGYWVDDIVVNGGYSTYYGPTNTPETISDDAWIASAGTHTISWRVDSVNPEYNDWDRSNNEKHLTFTISPVATTTQSLPRYTIDWALSNPSMSPPSPKVGDQVTFNVDVTQLSSDWAGGLGWALIVKLDGNAFYHLEKQYPGPVPVGTTETVHTDPWTATGGTHSVTWQLIWSGGDETVILMDPNSSNQQASLQFSVSPSTTSIQTLTQVPTTTQAGATVTPTSTIIQTVTQTPTGGGPFLALGQTDLLIIGLMAAALILMAALVLRRRRRTSHPAVRTPSASARIVTGFCMNCGAPLERGKPFCGSCGKPVET